MTDVDAALIAQAIRNGFAGVVEELENIRSEVEDTAVQLVRLTEAVHETGE